MTQVPQYLTPEDVAAALKVSRSWVYQALRRGEIRSIRVGRLPRIPQEALAEYLAATNDTRGGRHT